MSESLSMANKVLLALYRLSLTGRKRVRYEDVVVRVFQDYPSDFHLKGHPQFPDSGDAVHKPLYDYRQKGMVTASNKMFGLTELGHAEAERLLDQEAGNPPAEQGHRLQRTAHIELGRVKQLESFKLFLEGRRDDIIDADLFDYLGVSVRTSKNDFIGRLHTLEAALAEAQEASPRDPVVLAFREFHKFMTSKFRAEIDFKVARIRKERPL